MRSASGDEMPAEIKRARLRFVRWRKNRKAVTRIPDRLWTAAVEAARVHGVNPTAIALGLDYNHLKRRTRSTKKSARRKKAKRPSFVELIVPPKKPDVPECTIELENARGARMKVHLENVEIRDVVAWIERVWSEPR